MAADVELWSDHNFTSPWVLTVWFALSEKGVPFTVRAVNLKRGEHRSGELARHVPTAKIPALRHGDFWLGESLAIAEYVNDVFPGPSLLPADPRARAQDRAMLAWLRSDLFALREAMPFEGVVIPGLPSPEVTPAARAQAARLLEVASRFVAGRAPDAATLADLDLAATVRRLMNYQYDLSGHAAVVAHCERLWQRPSVQSFVRHERPAG